MNGGRTGIGSASAVLLFTVLCLGVLAMIAHTAAANEKALAEAEAAIVMGYYEADALAERVVSGILAGADIPAEALGVAVTEGRDEASPLKTAEFACAVTDKKELHVKIAIRGDTRDVLIWRMRDREQWEPDSRLPVWPGE